MERLSVFIVPKAQEDAAKRKHVSKQNFCWSLNICSFQLDILLQGSQTIQFRVCDLGFFFTFLTRPPSHPTANACLFLDVFIYKYTLLCCEQCVNVGLGKCVNVLMWVWANNLQSTLRLIFLVTGEPTPLSAVHWYTCVITIITIIKTIIIIFINIII